MPRKETSKPLHILVSEDERNAINAFAEQQGYKITADYIRSLIERDMQSKGIQISLTVVRGGDRRKKGDSTPVSD